eukprot:m.344293 g.344293  ORF g.344293 m.344293 type:complete len:593 (-) comp24147_c0_seq1:129-1907(-)
MWQVVSLLMLVTNVVAQGCSRDVSLSGVIPVPRAVIPHELNDGHTGQFLLPESFSGMTLVFVAKTERAQQWAAASLPLITPSSITLRIQTDKDEIPESAGAIPIYLSLDDAKTQQFMSSNLSDEHGRIMENREEAYHLSFTGIDEHDNQLQVSIDASHAAGLLYGVQTMLQILKSNINHSEGLIRGIHVYDSPVSSYRGIMIDNVRKVHNASFHMAILDKLAMYKLNIYHLHSSDDQGYSMPTKAYPNLPMAGALTQDEVVALQDKAFKLNITIVAEVDLPGHSTSLRQKLPSIVGMDTNGKPCNSINVTGAQSLNVLTTLLGELMEAFPGPYLHLGADEVRFNAACNFTKETYQGFINYMNGFAKKNNRTLIVWGGFDPNPMGTAPVVDLDVIVSPFDVLRELPWPHRPHNYYDAGYSMLNTAWNPLYIAGSAATNAEQLVYWNPTKYGKYPPHGCAPTQWQSLPSDNWNNPRYVSSFSGQNASCWPDTSAHSTSYIPSPYPSSRMRGGALCSWANPQDSEMYTIFGACGQKYNSTYNGLAPPAPRGQIVAQRLWSGASLDPSTLLENVGCSYWQPPPPPPSTCTKVDAFV